MSPPGRRRAAAALSLALGLAGCGPGPEVAPAGPTFTVGAITFRAGSAGVERQGGQLVFWLTDTPDTCQAIVGTPVQTTTFWRLRVAPPSSGATAASVVPPKLTLAPGEADGRLEQRTGGVAGTGHDAADGTISWTGGAAGPITVDALDVGYAGAAGRVTAAGLVFRACN